MGQPVHPSCVGVVFDGDDTLWETERLYDDARASARAIVDDSGLSGREWELLEREIDVLNVKIYGFSPERFPTSCVQAYQQLSERECHAIEPAISRRVYAAAREVFQRDAIAVTNARETLSHLHFRGFKTALLTKGDREVQENRIRSSGLCDLFDAVLIVSDKTPGTFVTILNDLGVESRNSWMVGNSMRSDILPALEAGLGAVWIRAHVWEFERTSDHVVDERVVLADEIADVPRIISRVAETTDPPHEVCRQYQ